MITPIIRWHHEGYYVFINHMLTFMTVDSQRTPQGHARQICVDTGVLHRWHRSCNFDTTTTLKQSCSIKGLQQEAIWSQQALRTCSCVARQSAGALHCDMPQRTCGWVGSQPGNNNERHFIIIFSWGGPKTGTQKGRIQDIDQPVTIKRKGERTSLLLVRASWTG